MDAIKPWLGLLGQDPEAVCSKEVRVPFVSLFDGYNLDDLDRAVWVLAVDDAMRDAGAESEVELQAVRQVSVRRKQGERLPGEDTLFDEIDECASAQREASIVFIQTLEIR